MDTEKQPWPAKTLAEGYGILCLGLPRTGTLSLTTALGILGYDRVHHGTFHIRTSEGYVSWGRGPWCFYPYMRNEIYPNRTPPWLPNPPTSFTQADFDDIVGRDYQGASDFAAIVAPFIIAAYPNAKVILVERDIDKWAESFNDVLIHDIEVGSGWFVRVILGPLMNFWSYTVLWDTLRSWLRAKDGNEMRARLKDAYREHYALVREIVPAENLLNYRLGDGWGPICEFLGQPIPNVPYPRVNDRAAVLRSRQKRRMLIAKKAGSFLGSVAGASVVVWLAFVYGERLIDTCRGIITR